MDYKETLNLPRTGFPMRANLPVKEKEILKEWAEGSGIYSDILNARADAPSFILHDGPPYANGQIHMGHALNKTLKDFVLKYKALKGFRVPYIPGWDCHGLPIELGVSKEYKDMGLSVAEFRHKCRNSALKFVEKQAKDFKRLGIFGDWDSPYLTIQPEYEAGVLEIFKSLVLGGYIFKQKKPVYWCPGCETALAEAEIEYDDHTSPSIYVKFEDKSENGTYYVIWTTTPWTLPANVAIALHPDFTYVKVGVMGEKWIVGEPLLSDMMDDLGISEYKILEKYKGSDLERKVALHPFIEDRESLIVLADYVTDDAGTGCVHTAPGHGQDDYVTGLRYGLPILNPVDDSGRYTDEFAAMKGVHVFDANDAVVELLRKKNALIKVSSISHSYPHCWRCKKPVIFRATEQWFVKIDNDGLRGRILDRIKETKWIPEWGENRITAMVQDRPDWCISRQRSWGVPITMFYCPECGEYAIEEDIMERAVRFVEKNGSDGWFTHDEDAILGELNRCPGCGSKGLKKDMNILDVWFESGSSYKSVVSRRKDLGFPADLYLEGSDQHRGWFNSSITLSTAENGSAPFKQVLTHGFIVDGQGRKMSKSLGNGLEPQDIIGKYGADVLRLWVASENYRNDMPISEEIVARVAEAYRRIRNTFRFMLGVVADFNPDKDAVPFDDMPEIDRYMTIKLAELVKYVETAYEEYEFHKVYHSIHNFCSVKLSSFYLDGSKSDWISRRSTLTVIWKTLTSLVKMVSPIMPFTAHEIWEHLKEKTELEKNIHLSLWPEMERHVDEPLTADWTKLEELREDMKKVLEAERSAGIIGHSLDARLIVYSEDESEAAFLKKHLDDIKRINIVSEVAFEHVENMTACDKHERIMVFAEKSVHGKCERCWEYSESVGDDEKRPELCSRCINVLDGEGR